MVGAAFFGTNRRNPSTDKFLPNNNDEIPIAILQGSLDGVALAHRAQKTYDLIEDPPKTLITITGANHYGITNSDSTRDPNRPTLDQSVANETIARWSALFLRATVLNDPGAYDYVFNTGDAEDRNVTVISQTKTSSQPAFILGVLTFSIFSTFYFSKSVKNF